MDAVGGGGLSDLAVEEEDVIPLSKPFLPKEGFLRPYLKRIDGNRYYSNVGPLVIEFEDRLEEMFGATCVTASSATSALTATLIALQLPKSSLVAVPSWTFPATAAAIVAAGHTPCFVDVGEDGITNAKDVTMAMVSSLQVNAVVAVSPFGARLDVEAWDRFSNISGIPVIIDAAAGFDSFSTLCRPGRCPVVISTHCTKPFGTGEGSFVTCSDRRLLDRVRQICNFGIGANREVETCGINGKMSEYHAAVGLAESDGWKEKRRKWIEVSGWYAAALGLLYAGSSEFASSTCRIHTAHPASLVVKKLAALGVDASVSRYGCHLLPAYSRFPESPLPVTEDLMAGTVMLPMFVDMTMEQVEFVARSVREVLR